MSVRAEGSNAPLRKGDKRKIKLVKKWKHEFMSQGMSEDEAEQKAQIKMREEIRKD